MRTIKFRGKVSKGYNEDFFKQKFVYGNAIICEDEVTSTIINDEYEAEVDTNTIGQFTGLKDKNGNEIYEGDILQVRYKPNYTLNTFEVKWYDENASFVCYRKHDNPQVQFEQLPLYPSNSMEDLEVIGNIYENPELLQN